MCVVLMMDMVFFFMMLGVMKYLLSGSYVLMSVLCLEFISLNMVLVFGYMSLHEGLDMFIYFLVIIISEAVMSLSLVIRIVYTYGSEMFSVISKHK